MAKKLAWHVAAALALLLAFMADLPSLAELGYPDVVKSVW